MLSDEDIALRRSGGPGNAILFSAKYADVLIVPWVFEPSVLFAYLTARTVTLLIPIALAVLGWKAAPQLAVLALAHNQLPFQAAAARVNLGYLMVCGSMALFVLFGGPYVAANMGISDPVFQEVLLWLVIGQSAPVFFGATGLLMRTLNRGVISDLLTGITAVFFVLCIAILGASDSMVVAQALAAAQLAHAAICALLLTQSGVWPGLTALFHKQIRIF
jgi:hypothetical protein